MQKYRVIVKVSGPGEGSRVGLIGMTVRVMARCPAGELLLGEAVTRANGSAEIAIKPPPEAIRSDGSVLVREVISDRDGLIVDEGRRARAVKNGQPLSIACRLTADQVESHISRPLEFEPGGSQIDRSWLENGIDLALGALAAPGSPEFTNLRAAALCPGPPIDLFDELTRDAIDVLDGDPTIITRFEDTLELLRDRQATTRPRRDVEPADAPVLRVDRPGATPLVDVRSVSPNLRRVLESPGPRATGRMRTMIPREQGALAMAAAVHVAADNSAALRNLDLVFDTLCQFEEVGVLRRIGLDGLTDPSELARFRGILGALGGEWGPDDGPPIPDLPRIPCRPFVDQHADCIRDIANSIRNPVPTYTITGVDAVDACPGDTIEITGSGFTDDPGKVTFNRRSGGPIDVDADVWTDTRIGVRVPANATCGVRLRIHVRTDRFCDHFIAVYRRPNILVNFAGGAANISWFNVHLRSGTVCITPGEIVELAWGTCAADTTSVVVRDASGGILASSNAVSGTLTLTAPATGGVTTWTATATVTGHCAPTSTTRTLTIQIEPRPDLQIDGVEVTQGIQHYHANLHLTNSVGPDNSLPLVVGKMAWVRVYVRSGVNPTQNGGDLNGVTGSIRLERVVGGVRQFVANLAPINAPITARSDWPTLRAERGGINNTLNFQIPANQMTGRLRLEIDVDAPNSCHGSLARDTHTTEVDVAQRNRLRLRGVPFAFQPPAGSGFTAAAAPTLAQFRTDLALAYAQWPTAVMRNIDATLTATQTTANALNDPRTAPGACSPNWGTLLTALNQAATNDGPRANTVYYGYLPATIPVAVPGCGSGGRGAGRQGDTFTMTHEIGHGLGRQHSPCGNTPGDNNYTVYQPYDAVVSAPAAANVSLQRASIGEFGLDIRNGNIFDPNTTSDLMSYCNPSWISKYVHNQVFNTAIMNPTGVPVGAAGPIQAAGAPSAGFGDNVGKSALIVMWGSLDDGSVEVSSLVRLETTTHVGPETDLIAELIGDDGSVLSAAPVVAMVNDGGCNCASGSPVLRGEEASFDFRVDMPDVAVGRGLRIRRGKSVLWSRSRPNRRPRVQNVKARVRRDGQLEVTWSATVDEDATSAAWITCSAPQGDDHQGLATGVAGNKAVLDVQSLAGGKAVVAVRISDGFNCASGTSKVVEIPGRRPEVVILYPQDGEIAPADGALCLQGILSDEHDQPFESCEWLVDGEVVGTTPDVTVPTPVPGEHTVELRAGRVNQKVKFTVAPSPADAPLDEE